MATKIRKLAKGCTKAVSHKKNAQEGKLQENHVSRKGRKVLEIKEGIVSKRTKACQAEKQA